MPCKVGRPRHRNPSTGDTGVAKEGILKRKQVGEVPGELVKKFLCVFLGRNNNVMKFVQENLLAWWRNPHPLATTDRKYSSNMLTSALTVFTSLDEAKKLSLYNIFLNGFF